MSDFDLLAPHPDNKSDGSNTSEDFEKIHDSDVTPLKHQMDEFDPLSTPSVQPSAPEKPSLPESPADLSTEVDGFKGKAVVGTSKNDSPSCTTNTSCCLKEFRKLLSTLDPRVVELIHWTNPKKSGLVFALSLVALLVLRCCSLISVVSYLALGILSATLSYRLVRAVLCAIQKSGESNPFKQYLEQDIEIPSDKVHQSLDLVIEHGSSVIMKLRRLFLIEDIVDSLKVNKTEA